MKRDKILALVMASAILVGTVPRLTALENNRVTLTQDEIDAYWSVENDKLQMEYEQNLDRQRAGETVSLELLGGGNIEMGTTRRIAVTANFNDITESGKVVKFNLPEGMEYETVMVNSSFNDASINQNIIKVLDEDDILNASLVSVDIPVAESDYGYATFGEVSYSFESNLESVTIYFDVKIDDNKYYGSKSKTISAEIFENGVSVGTTDIQGNLVGDDLSKTGNFMNSFVTANLLQEYSFDTIPGNSKYTRPLGIYNQIAGDNEALLFEKAVMKIYYPEGVELNGLIFDSTGRDITETYAKDWIITDNKTENFVTVEVDMRESVHFHTDYLTIALGYDVPNDIVPGSYPDGGINTAVYTMYDGTEFNLVQHNRNGIGEKTEVDVINVTDPNIYYNKLTLSDIGDISLNDFPEESFYGFPRVDNETPIALGPYNVGISYDSNVKNYQVRIPFDGKLESNFDSLEIQYKTNKNDNWVVYSGDYDIVGEANESIHLDSEMAGLASGEWFTEVRASIGMLSSGYTNNRYSTETSLGWGTPIEETDSISTGLDFWIGDLDSVNEDTLHSVVYEDTKGETRYAQLRGTSTFYNNKGEIVDSIQAGEGFTYNGRVAIYKFMHGNITTLTDPVIFLRQPSGIDFYDIILTDNDGNEIAYDIDEIVVDNEILYKIETKDFELNSSFDMESITGGTDRLNFILRATTDPLSINRDYRFDISDLIAITDDEDTIYSTSSEFTDKMFEGKVDLHGDGVFDGFDINNDGVNDSTLPSVSSLPFSISKIQTLYSVSTFEHEDGSKFPEYNENDTNTIVTFEKGQEGNYNVDFTNLLGRSIDSNNGDNFICYLPIPKDGLVISDYLQKEEFEFDMLITDGLELGEDFEVSYATIVGDNFEGGNYVDTYNSAEHNMIRIELKDGAVIENKGQFNFKIPFTIVQDEYKDILHDNNLNVLKSYYRVITDDMNVGLEGKSIGISMNIENKDLHYELTGKIPDSVTIPEKGNVVDGGETNVAVMPEIPGYTFSGWELKEGEGVLVNGVLTGGTTDVTLIGEYIPNNYIIKFDMNSGDGTADDILATFDEEALLTDVIPTKDGFVFKGYNSSADGSGITYQPEQSVINLTDVPNGEVILYAQWEEIPPVESTLVYEVTGDKQDGFTVPSGGIIVEDVPYITEVMPDLVGYTFSGWDIKNGEGVYDGIALTPGKTDVVMTGQYIPNVYSITLHPQNDDTPITGELIYDKPEDLSAMTDPVKDGFVFKGYNSEPDGTGTMLDLSKPLLNLTTENGVDIPFYAIWEAIPPTETIVEYEIEGVIPEGVEVPPYVNAVEGVEQPVSEMPEVKGYEFSGWSVKDGDVVLDGNNMIPGKENSVLVGKYIPYNYTIILDPNGFDGDDVIIGATFDVETQLEGEMPKVEDYILIGYNSEPDGSGTQYMINETVINLTDVKNGEVTLYAQWVQRPEVVTEVNYEVDGDIPEGFELPPSIEVGEGMQVEIDKVKEIPGYTFSGWELKEGDAIIDENGILTGGKENNLLVGKFVEHSYNLIIKPENGEEDSDAYELKFTDSFAWDGYSEPVFEGHILKGFSLNEDGSGDLFSYGDILSRLSSEDGDTVYLYAIWEESAIDEQPEDDKNNNPFNPDTGDAGLIGAISVFLGAILALFGLNKKKKGAKNSTES